VGAPRLGPRAGLYAGLGVLTSVGPFLFTRFIIPEAQLSLFLLIALTPAHRLRAGPVCALYWMWRPWRLPCSPRD